MIAALHIVALLLYGAAAAVLGVSFARGGGQLARGANAALGVGVVAHAVGLVLYAAEYELPLVGLGPSLSTFAWLVALGTLIATSLSRARTLGLVLVPVVALLSATALAVGIHPARDAMQWRSAWFALHVLFAFVGYAGLAVAFAAGLMYLLQHRELKSKHFGAIFRFFPPLDSLDRLGRLGLMVGFPFLTLAVLLGSAWAARFGDLAVAGGDKLAWVFLSWLVFAGALAARLGGGRGGRRGALASVVGFVVVVLIYMVLRVQGSHGGAFL